MITLEHDRCSGCGLCAKICHESCITLVEGIPSIDRQFCSTCTQCIAVCPQRALAWDTIPPLAFDRANLPSPVQLDELFKERRSIRAFKKEQIERNLLEEIAGYGIYAPTHNFGLRAILVDEADLIADLDRTMFEYNRRIYRLAYQNRVVAGLASLLGYQDEFLKAKPKVEAVLSRGQNFSSLPAAFVFILGAKNVPLSEASAQYALANMMFFAQVKGVGTCLWGNAPIFLDKNKAVRRRLGIQKHERIYGALSMGYPAVKFANKVNGKTLPIQWNCGEGNNYACN